MKKIVFIFFILLMMEAFAFASETNVSLNSTETPQASPVPRQLLFPKLESYPSYNSDNTCLIGNTNLRVYANQMDKTNLTEQDSFLAKYKNEQEKHLVPNYFRESNFKSYINKGQVLCAMKRIPMVSQNKKSCSKSAEAGTAIKQTPCVTGQMVDYIHWGLNEAMRCYDSILDSHERKIIFKKINHESAFGFFFQYAGGTGIAQLIGGSQKDLFLPGYAGNNYLTNHVQNHIQSCESFVRLLSRTPKFGGKKNSKANSCEFMSVGDGIGRSLIGGISLYLHYRDDPQNPYSAQRLLNYWGYKNSGSEKYKQVRSYITLGMYNKGPGAVLDRAKKAIGAGALAKKSDEEAYNIVMKLIKNSGFYGYVKAVENSTNQIFDRNGGCKI